MNAGYCPKCGVIASNYDMDHNCMNCGLKIWFERIEDIKNVVKIELRQYTNSHDIVRYHAVEVNDNGSEGELLIDSCVYSRALKQAKQAAECCKVPFIDRTSHSDLFSARSMAEAHALMKKD